MTDRARHLHIPLHFPDTPEPIVCAPDDEIIIEDAQTAFFTQIVSSLGYVSIEPMGNVNIRSRELLREGDVPVVANLTNDRVSELVIDDRTVASVLRVRTEFNYVQALFAAYPAAIKVHDLL